MASDLHYLELIELARLIQTRELSPVEATAAQLARINSLDRKLKSYAVVLAETALAQARNAEAEIMRGQSRGLLHGVPVAVKDLCWMKGVSTAAGMPIYKDFRPAEDATVVRKLSAAGAIILGKLQMTEGAFAQHHPQISSPVNPWNAAYWPGVSSSGSGVATAAGLCYGSIGTDTGGSIRFPSAANGVTGLKPTWGRVSRYGVFELAATLDHIGPMARSAADCGVMLGAIAGDDPNDPTAAQQSVPDYLADAAAGLRGLRIGVDAAYNSAGVDETAVKAVNAAIEVVRGLGADLREVSFPDVTDVLDDWLPLCAVQAAVAHAPTYPSRASEYGPRLVGLLDLGRAVTAGDYQRMILRRLDFRGRVAALLQGIDLLIVPAQGIASPTNALLETPDAERSKVLGRFTFPFDMSGSPTITLPCGFTGAGTPLAFQFVAKHFDEAMLVRAGRAYQSTTDWHRKHPQLAA